MSIKRDAVKTTADGIDVASVGSQALESLVSIDGQSAGKEELADTLSKLDAERHALVQSTIDRLKAGAPVDGNSHRRIRAIDAQKNRLLVSRFAVLLRENELQIKPLVAQLLQI